MADLKSGARADIFWGVCDAESAFPSPCSSQLSHPGIARDLLTLIAHGFVSLTRAKSKKGYIYTCIDYI